MGVGLSGRRETLLLMLPESRVEAPVHRRTGGEGWAEVTGGLQALAEGFGSTSGA